MGENALVIKERLGHEDIQTTLGTYGHLYPNSNIEVAQKLNRAIKIQSASSNLTSNVKNQFTKQLESNIKNKAKNLILSRIFALFILFPLDRTWWLTCNIINYTIYVWHFIYNPNRNLL